MFNREQSVRAFIVDANTIFRIALRHLLEQQTDLRVIGEAADGSQAVQQVKQLKPDVLLLDLALHGITGLEVLRELAILTIETKTIVLTESIKRFELAEALKLGAHGVILKDVTTPLLLKGIRAVMAGECWVDVARPLGLRVGESSSSQELMTYDRRHHLSRRELEIVAAISDGYTNKDIAQSCSLSEQTVKHHLTRIYSKLGVTNRVELASYAVQHNLASQRLAYSLSTSTSGKHDI